MLYWFINKTHTFIKELQAESCCGELAFFVDQPRRVTIRSKNFTEVLYISRDDFLNIVEEDEISMNILQVIQRKIRKRKNLTGIGVV